MNPLGPVSLAALVASVLVTVAPAHAADPLPTCRGESATIVGTANADRLVGTVGRDVVVARDGDDVVLALGGDDLVCGGDGADTLHGGAGDDRLHGQRESRLSDRGGTYFVPDVLDGGPGDDLLDTGDDDRWVDHGSHGVLDFTGAAAGVRVDLADRSATGEGTDTLRLAAGPDCGADCFGTEVLGSAHDDVLGGSDGADQLVGNDGDDVLDGRRGADLLLPDGTSQGDPGGDDDVRGGAGRDVLSALDGSDHLWGNGGDDTVWQTGGGPSEVHGGIGDDRLSVWFAGEPGFVLDGGAGDDSGGIEGPAAAGAGGRPTAALVTRDTGLVTSGEVTWGRVVGIEDLGLFAELGWTYRGTDDPELLRSAGTWLRARTYGGDDEVWGTAGPDRIDAGDGVDTVRGGRGRDTCRSAEDVRSCEVRS